MRNNIFRIVATVAAIYHICLGLVGLFLPIDVVERVASFAFRLELELSPQLSIVASFASAYMLSFGIMMGMLAYQPLKNKAFVLPALILFGVRFLNRLFHFEEISVVFNTHWTHNIPTLIILGFFFLAILLTRPIDSLKAKN